MFQQGIDLILTAVGTVAAVGGAVYSVLVTLAILQWLRDALGMGPSASFDPDDPEGYWEGYDEK